LEQNLNLQIFFQAVFLLIENGKIDFRHKSKLWGLEVAEAVKEIKGALEQKVRRITIGPGLEKLTCYLKTAINIVAIVIRYL